MARGSRGVRAGRAWWVREISEVIRVRLEKDSLDVYACKKEGNDVWDKDQLLIFILESG